MFRTLAVLVVSLALAAPTPLLARTSSSHHSSSSKPRKSSGGKVHVKSYTKKDGTHVDAHTRSAPKAKRTKAPKAPKAAKAPKAPKAPRTKGRKGGASTSLYTYGPRPSSPTACVTCERDENNNGRIKRSAATRADFMRQTGYPDGRPGYVVDHVTPLECGGSDEASNMQWQTVEEAKLKDTTEHACRQ